MLFEKFPPPPINHNTYPGSWSPLKRESSFTIPAIEKISEYIITKYPIDPTFDINILTAGVQVVAGLNIYVEFVLSSKKSGDIWVQALVNIDLKNNVKVEKVFATHE